MKGNDGVIKVLTGFVMVLALTVIGSGKAEAYGGWRGHGHWDHHEPAVILSDNYFSIVIGRERYYRHHGHYYRRHRHGGFIEVSFPRTVIITSIPRHCRKVYIDGRNYYTYNGDYYVPVAGGYQMVDRPSGWSDDNFNDNDNVTDIQPQTGSSEPFTVNIPNSKGGYTAVTLKRSGSGYTGPQGEYYSDFPKVEQLRAMYGK